jgi:hypothetical protein
MSEHEWVKWDRPLDQALESGHIYYCQVCGMVKRADGKNNPCKGPIKVALR